MKLWIARDNAIIPDDMEHFIERHPEKEIEYAKLHIFYDKPIWEGNYFGGSWKYARECYYMFQYPIDQIKERNGTR